jgi:hypothetical protein
MDGLDVFTSLKLAESTLIGLQVLPYSTLLYVYSLREKFFLKTKFLILKNQAPLSIVGGGAKYNISNFYSYSEHEWQLPVFSFDTLFSCQ